MISVKIHAEFNLKRNSRSTCALLSIDLLKSSCLKRFTYHQNKHFQLKNHFHSIPNCIKRFNSLVWSITSLELIFQNKNFFYFPTFLLFFLRHKFISFYLPINAIISATFLKDFLTRLSLEEDFSLLFTLRIALERLSGSATNEQIPAS